MIWIRRCWGYQKEFETQRPQPAACRAHPATTTHNQSRYQHHKKASSRDPAIAIDAPADEEWEITIPAYKLKYIVFAVQADCQKCHKPLKITSTKFLWLGYARKRLPFFNKNNPTINKIITSRTKPAKAPGTLTSETPNMP